MTIDSCIAIRAESVGCAVMRGDEICMSPITQLACPKPTVGLL
jgi:hypothetical protein